MSLQRNTTIAVILAIVVIIIFVTLGFFGIRSLGGPSVELSGPQAILDELQKTGTVSGLHIYDFTVGTGEEVQNGNLIAVHYTGVLPDGTVFDSSYDRGEPIVFQLGAGQVIQGWEQGLQGMRVGGRRLIAIPPDLAYGANSVGSIPANATLIFDVELVQILPAATPAQ